MNYTIEGVVKKGLCTGCGTCAGVCPSDAIKITANGSGLLSSSITGYCNHCGFCYASCPGHSVDFNQLNLAFFGKKPENVLIGNFIECYTGYAKDASIRIQGSSGGLVTSLLIFAFEQGLIDGAIITKMDEKNPTRPCVFIARTVEELVSAQSSKYCPVPANIALKEILSKEGKYAVVGLPCHIQGIRKAEILNANLRKRIVLHLGLFCSHNTSFKGTDYLLHHLDINAIDVEEISFRGRGWPGILTIKTKNGKIKEVPYHSYREGLFNLCFFTPQRCLQCVDTTCELSDISFGDAWFSNLLSDHIGTSVAISRSPTGQKLLLSAIKKDNIFLEPIDVSYILKQHGNRGTLTFKKATKARFFPFMMLCKPVPTYSINRSISTPMHFVVSFQSFLNSYLSTKHQLWETIPALSALTLLATRVFNR